MKIPKKLQCTTMEDALATAAGIVESIPFWHADLMAAAIAMRKKMQALLATNKLTPDGRHLLFILDYFFDTYKDTRKLLTHALSFLFLKPNGQYHINIARKAAEGIIHCSGLKISFSKNNPNNKN